MICCCSCVIRDTLNLPENPCNEKHSVSIITFFGFTLESYVYCNYYLKYRSECTTGNIAQGCGREANIARGEAIFASRSHPRAIFPVVHKHKRYFNWFIATYTERYCIFQGKI